MGQIKFAQVVVRAIEFCKVRKKRKVNFVLFIPIEVNLKRIKTQAAQI